MKKLLALLSTAFITLSASQWAFANEFTDLRSQLSAARESLVTMMVNNVAAELNLQRFSRSEPVFSSGSVFF